MIQFRRGKTLSWLKQIKPLADGQPGYDKKKHKIKVGDGTTPWFLLPSASGLSSEEILASEEDAKKRQDEVKSELGSLLGKLTGLDLGLEATGGTVITYGEEAPDENTVGQVYLQHYSTEPETDYIIAYGIEDPWIYQIWKSGIVKCWGRTTIIINSSGEFSDETKLTNYQIDAIEYPKLKIQNKENQSEFTIHNFKRTPVEIATMQGGNIAWLSSRTENSKEESAAYSIISPYDLQNVTFYISLEVTGEIAI
jgi:hypothetical protein